MGSTTDGSRGTVSNNFSSDFPPVIVSALVVRVGENQVVHVDSKLTDANHASGPGKRHRNSCTIVVSMLTDVSASDLAYA